MTGSLSKGGRAAVRRYNAIVQYLEQTGFLPTGFFNPLPEDTTFDELGVESSLLASYIEEDADSGEVGGPWGNFGATVAAAWPAGTVTMAGFSTEGDR